MEAPKQFFEKILSSSWKTTLWGYITLLAAAITFNPPVIDFLTGPLSQETIEQIKGWAGLITFLTGATFVHAVKDKDVTGTPANDEKIKALIQKEIKKPIKTKRK